MGAGDECRRIPQTVAAERVGFDGNDQSTHGGSQMTVRMGGMHGGGIPPRKAVLVPGLFRSVAWRSSAHIVQCILFT